MSHDECRRYFPHLVECGWIFAENAGGSQVPTQLIDTVSHYFRNNYAQLSAGYPMSDRATATVNKAHSFVETLMNAPASSVMLGSSSTSLIYEMAQCFGGILAAGDEVIVAECAHEANAGPWTRAATAAGATVRTWTANKPADVHSVPADHSWQTLSQLTPLLNSHTRIVAFPHVSNLLGEITDVAAVTRAIRANAPNAIVCVDGVAFAPHRAIDVTAWDVDLYVFSTYKVFGPHMGAMFVHDRVRSLVQGPNHYFVPANEFPYKFELGGCSHEGCAGLLGTERYLRAIGRGKGESPGEEEGQITRSEVERAFSRIAEWEREGQEILLEYLNGAEEVSVVGPASSCVSVRVPTVSFVHRTVKPSAIVTHLHSKRIAVRNGHMYAHRLTVALGLDVEQGVVRVSLAHYNTPAEVRYIVDALKELFVTT